ncbi:MAG: 30S ribosomal protein S12 methylthiotransferase RimO, partial [Treponema sp.]|nr:30S ribosomal protein S12 methylthiotransferase RimO [Treponema sp.]
MTYYLDPFGCVKNQVDAENMMAFLNRAGWTGSENPEDSDLIIINSCGFIEEAKRESINAVLNWRKLYPAKKILLAGCLAQRYAKELAESLPEADGLFGVGDLPGIVRAAGEILKTTTPVPGTGKAKLPPGKRPLLSLPGSAYVKISEGCDNRCSFCAIPLIRGGLVSRSISDLTAECKTLLARGIKELCLIGQDTGSYGLDLAVQGGGMAAIQSFLSGHGTGHTPGRSPKGHTAAGGHNRAASLPASLPDLLASLSHLEGDFWVRLLYIHPDHFPLSILDIMEQDKRFLPYFDIPFQHGSKKILTLMNRRGNQETYLRLIETIRLRLPDAVIRSTFLTGFPGETEEDFQSLLDFQEKARLDWLGCFAYSREEGTAAWGMKGRVGKKTQAVRKRLIEERQIPITEKQMDRFIGRTFEVLVEEKFDAPVSAPGEAQPDEDSVSPEPVLYLGRLPCQAPEVDGSA